MTTSQQADESFTGSLQLLQEARSPLVALRVPAVYMARNGAGQRPDLPGQAQVHPGYTAGTTRVTRRWARPPRWCRGRRPRPGRGRGGVGEPLGAGLVGRGLITRGFGDGGRPGAGDAGLLPLTRVAVSAATLMPACPAITATAAPAGSADSAARTAAAGLSPAAGKRARGAGSVAASAALRAACGAGAGVRDTMVTPFLFSGAIPFSFACAGVFWTTTALVRA
jgi:hypothetical protein